MAETKGIKISNGTEELQIININGGFEIFYGGQWYFRKDGLISPLLFTPLEQERT